MWCPFIVVCDIGDSDGHIAIDGTPSRGFTVSRVNSVEGDVLGMLGFEFISIFVLGFVNDVRLKMTVVIVVGGI